MSVSVVIVNYNAGDWLARCLNSVLPLTHVDHVYVVDNDSHDNSLELIRPHLDEYSAKLSLIKNQQNVGFAAANNQVLNHYLGKPFNNDKTSLLSVESQKSDYVLLLNPDCEMNAEVLPTMLAEFDANPQVGIASCVIRNEDGSLQTTCRRQFPTPMTALTRMLQLQRLGLAKNFDLGDQPLPKSFTTTEAISGAFMLVRVSAMKDVGVLDESYFMHCEDLDWCKRFNLLDWQVGFVPNASVIHAKGISSQSRPVGVLWTLHKGMLRFFDKFYRNEYSIFIRVLVKIGVVVSFILRASWSLLTSLLGKNAGKPHKEKVSTD